MDVAEVVIEGKPYYRKPSVYPAVEMWNTLYPTLLNLGYLQLRMKGMIIFQR